MRTYKSTKEIAATIRETLKRELPEWKFSVRMKSFAGGSSIDLSLMSGPEEVLVGYAPGTNGREWGYDAGGYAQLNQYSFLVDTFSGRDERVSNGYQLTPKGWEVMDKAIAILSAEHWDDSDIQSDYFSTNFYMHVSIGQWDKPYEVKVK